MGFTVTHPGGIADAEFPTYARLLRQRGVDLGKLPRVRDPIAQRRWLHVWNARAEAEAFAQELKAWTGDRAWEVVEVNGAASEGPLGSVVIQLVRQVEGLTFGLHPLSRAMLRSAFSQTVSPTTYVTVDTSTWDDFRKTKGGLNELVREIVPSLTGLSRDQLEALGYAVVDADTNQTLLSAPVAATANGS
ncbi:MAG: hypothetical protein ACRELG_17880 [Gemmataceae bacterium]